MKKNSHAIFVFGIPALLILINFIAIIVGVIILDKVQIFDKIPEISVLFFWLPLLMILINGIIIVYGIFISDTNAYAKASIIFALLFFLPALNIITNLLALVFGIKSLKEIAKTHEKGKMLALAAITIAIVALIFSFLGFVLYPEIYIGVDMTRI